MARPILFADTNVQIICFPLRPDQRYGVDQTGVGWQHCTCQGDEGPVEYGYLQWQIHHRKLYLAVDTSISPGDVDTGYFAKAASLAGDVVVTLSNLIGANGTVFTGMPTIEFVIRSATAEEPRDVHMVVDFGNSRTGALLLEFRGDSMQEPMMTPLQLVNRFQLDDWDEKGEWIPSASTQWFSSKTHWCTTPYLAPRRLEKTELREKKTKGMLGKEKTEYVKVTVFETPRTFEDFSMVRLGREVDDLTGIIRSDGEDVRTGVSSPKRYLWAKDAAWLEGANWHMADPFDRFDRERRLTSLKGPLLRFLSEDDSLEEPVPQFEESPNRPRHAPRVLMTAALYELLCQAFTYSNSPAYRKMIGDAGRVRVLRTLTLTFPAGMIAQERAQLAAQARKAISVFMQTIGRAQRVRPELELSIDEASAVHLTYLWSEVRKLGQKSSLWFSVMGREPIVESVAKAAAAKPDGVPAAPGHEVRIACIDVGGGTSDLMIAKYVCRTGQGGDLIEGSTLHRDGISIAGDHLMKRLLERIIVPHLARRFNMEPRDAQTLFGKEVPTSRHFRAERIQWVNRLLVPLAEAYLDRAVAGSTAKISHTDPEIVAPEVVQSLQGVVNKLWQAGKYNIKQDLALVYDRELFEAVVDEVFGDLLFDFCESIVDHQADIVLLAGLPTKLPYIRRLVETYLPLPKSRIVPMFERYAGTWYPYQSADNHNPGVIVDPKSTVVVGAAIEFSARHGMLSQFKYRMDDQASRGSYYWGVMTESRIDDEKLIFRIREGEEDSIDRKEIHVSAQTLIIGRKRRGREDAQASPIYVLKLLRNPQGPLGEIDVKVTLQRAVGPSGEEELSVESAEGTVDGLPAEVGYNVVFEWRTLADDKYYLDIGGLDKIELI